MCFTPLSCIDECLNPRSDIILQTVSWIVCHLPREDSTLKVWHHCKVTAVSRTKSCYVIVGTVRVCRIAFIVVLGNYAVLTFRTWQTELALSVCYPDTELVAAERTEEY